MATLPAAEKVLERQARSWELRQRLAERGAGGARGALARLPEGPWISVSRQLGSGGTELAARLADALEWQVFDREILTVIARHTHTQEAALAHLDERPIGPVVDFLTSVLDPGVPGRVPFLKEMLRVIWGVARKGEAVIVGRGANWFLDPRFGLRLRVVAPPERRIAWLVEREALDPSVAERRLHDDDDHQRSFIHQVYARSIDDPHGYDLVLNLGSLDVATATEVALAGVRRKLALAIPTT